MVKHEGYLTKFFLTESAEEALRKVELTRASLHISEGSKYERIKATQLSGKSERPTEAATFSSLLFKPENVVPILKKCRISIAS
ncbi:hypothetical protein Leryth_013200 [Lithospermum erythrorhizon]|nr:hypothetical protein Leryth_013200 [Lithospermum erythrorhizon]